MDDIKSYIQKTRKNTGKNIKEKPIPKYIIVRYLRTKCKKNLESSQKKTTKYEGYKNDRQLYVIISVIKLNINGLDIQTKNNRDCQNRLQK